MKLYELVDKLRSGFILLEDALEEEIPEYILHIFACDVAEKALLLDKSIGINAPQQCWETLHIKRRWMNGLCSDEELEEASKKLNEIIYSIVSQNAARELEGERSMASSYSFYWSVSRAASVNACRAAYWSSFWSNNGITNRTVDCLPEGGTYVSFKVSDISNNGTLKEGFYMSLESYEAEQEWKIVHLADLIEHHLDHQSSLLFLLKKRIALLKEQQSLLIPRWVRQTEENLYQFG